MEIQISEKFSHIEVVISSADFVIVQCALWPNWSELFEATKDKLTFGQLKELEDLFTAEGYVRSYEIEDEVLKIRSAQAVAI
jgi:hypothetical protein